MSGAESDAPAAAAGEPADLMESATDDHETRMTYDESSRVPWWVIAVWIIAMIGYLTYVSLYLFPDLATWGRP